MNQIIAMEEGTYPGSVPSNSRNVSCEDAPEITDASKQQQLFNSDGLLELSNSFWMRLPGAKSTIQPYLRGCKWSPDGTCCLSVVNRDGFHVMELPRDLYDGFPTRDRLITLLPAVIHVKESGLVYDFCWYPKMNSQYPETCSWISTKINSPIQMWDAYDGSLRCSYRGYNAVDEMEPAISVMFINNGQQIIGGYKNCLRTFDVERPGREFFEHKIKSPASCIATSGNLLAVGSWNANIQLFNILDNGTYRSLGNLHAHTGGITHLMFTPDGSKLVSGARKDHNLYVWDVRYHRRPLNILKRCVSTNQRIYFDISSCGRYLVSGGTDGVIRVWDNKIAKWTENFDVKYGHQDNATFQFQLHRDCCNSISIHPSRPIIATGSGQYHFIDPVKVLELECDKSTNCEKPSEEIKLSEHECILNDPSTDSQETVATNVDKGHEDDISEGSVLVMPATTKFSVKTPDHDISEEFLSATNKIKNIGESPPAKKLKRCDDINKNPIAEEKINSKSPETKFSLEGCNNPLNSVNINSRLNDTGQLCIESNMSKETDFENENEIKINPVNKKTSTHTGATGESLYTSKKPDPSIIKDLRQNQDYCHGMPDQNTQSIFNDNDEIRFPKKGESQLLSSLNTIEEVPGKSKLVALSHSNPLDKTSLSQLKADIDSEFPVTVNEDHLKQNKSSERESPTKMSVQNTERTADSKQTPTHASQSDDDYNDINDNEMKYSFYSENNLTFWWIGNIFK